MPYSCTVAGCSKFAKVGVRSCHEFPEEKAVADVWKRFVRRTYHNWPGPTIYSRICSDHFAPECYSNRMQWELKLSKRLDLIPGSVPTIYPKGTCNSPALPTPMLKNIVKSDPASDLGNDMDAMECEVSLPKKIQTTFRQNLLQVSKAEQTAEFENRQVTPSDVTTTDEDNDNIIKTLEDPVPGQVKMMDASTQFPSDLLQSSSGEVSGPQEVWKQVQSALLQSILDACTKALPFQEEFNVQGQLHILYDRTESLTIPITERYRNSEPDDNVATKEDQDEHTLILGKLKSESADDAHGYGHDYYGDDCNSGGDEFLVGEVRIKREPCDSSYLLEAADVHQSENENNTSADNTEYTSGRYPAIESGKMEIEEMCSPQNMEHTAASAVELHREKNEKCKLGSLLRGSKSAVLRRKIINANVKNRKKKQKVNNIKLTSATRMVGADNEGKFQCGYCGKKFMELFNLTAHERVHTGEKPYSCQYCCDTFRFTSSTLNHLKLTHPDRKNTGEKACVLNKLATFANKETRLEMLKQEERKLYSCLYCNATYIYSGRLVQHLHHLHADKRQPNMEISIDSKIGSFVLDVDDDFLGMKPYKCAYCGKAFRVCNKLIQHIHRMHKDELTNRSQLDEATVIPTGNFVEMKEKDCCQHCGDIFNNKTDLTCHLVRKHGHTGAFECRMCHKTFPLRRQMESCIYKHLGQKPFECFFEGCEKTFRSKEGRHTHMKTKHLNPEHGEMLKVTCDVCNRKFVNSGSLNRHMKKACRGRKAKEDPVEIVCEHCGKVFPKKVLLRSHLKCHSELDFMCELCGRQFRYKHVQKRHTQMCKNKESLDSFKL